MAHPRQESEESVEKALEEKQSKGRENDAASGNSDWFPVRVG